MADRATDNRVNPANPSQGGLKRAQLAGQQLAGAAMSSGATGNRVNTTVQAVLDSIRLDDSIQQKVQEFEGQNSVLAQEQAVDQQSTRVALHEQRMDFEQSHSFGEKVSAIGSGIILAHDLSEAIAGSPTDLKKQLDGQDVDGRSTIRKYAGSFAGALETVFPRIGRDARAKREAAEAGAEEIGGLKRLTTTIEDMQDGQLSWVERMESSQKESRADLEELGLKTEEIEGALLSVENLTKTIAAEMEADGTDTSPIMDADWTGEGESPIDKGMKKLNENKKIIGNRRQVSGRNPTGTMSSKPWKDPLPTSAGERETQKAFYTYMRDTLSIRSVGKKALKHPEVIAELGALQASLESGYGERKVANNYFGVKARKGEKGVTAMTEGRKDGKKTRGPGTFAEHGSVTGSADAYIDFLTRNPRYKKVLQADSIEEAIDLISESGYAEDEDYAYKLRQVMKKMR